MGRITLDGVTKRYDGELVAVEDLSLSIEDGEFLVLLGPSGCGKSTTLRMIAGLETVTDGDISIGDERVNDLEPRERDIAMVFQNYALYPHMTVEENIGFGLQLSTAMDDDAIAERVREVAEMMDIGDLLDKKPKQLSGGQQQRVALGRAIVREPAAFLFDEPLSNLDANLRSHMRTQLSRLQHELNVTAIYVTHDQAEALTMGDRIAVINAGRLHQVGDPNTIYDHPADRFVAEFIGEPSMNLLDGLELDRLDGTPKLLGDGGSSLDYPLESATVERLPIEVGDRLTLGVRPEDISVFEDLTTRRESAQLAEVDVVEPMGSDTFVYFELGGEMWVARTKRIEPAVGQEIAVDFQEDAVHLFDQSGQTLKSRGVDDAAYHRSADARERSQSVHG